jgi:hypothetical protein
VGCQLASQPITWPDNTTAVTTSSQPPITSCQTTGAVRNSMNSDMTTAIFVDAMRMITIATQCNPARVSASQPVSSVARTSRAHTAVVLDYIREEQQAEEGHVDENEDPDSLLARESGSWFPTGSVAGRDYLHQVL